MYKQHMDPGSGPEEWAGHLPRLEDFFQTRRQFLHRFGLGLGALSLATLFENQTAAQTAEAQAEGNAASPLLAKEPPLPARARHVVHIFAQGAPSQVDTWDPKPALAKYDGQPIPGANGVGYASRFKFSKHGKAG